MEKMTKGGETMVKKKEIHLLIEGERAKLGMGLDELAAELNLCKSTLHKRFKNNDEFTLGDVKVLAKKFNKKPSEIVAALEWWK